jgi:hypothetical protein
MKPRVYTDLVDRTGWADGPWKGEPDKIVWVDGATDLDCMMLRNHHGAWCGYVGVPPGHRFHGRDYGDVEVEVHGGLTFSDGCAPGPTEASAAICHDGTPGVWWLGFDCGHWRDRIPGLEARLAYIGHPLPDDPTFPTTYRRLNWVTREVEHLAAQLAE